VNLVWEPQRIRIVWRTEHTVLANVAQAPAGGWFLAWNAEHGWSIGRADDLTEPIELEPEFWDLPEQSDAELIARAWAAGLDDPVIKQHLGFDVWHDDEGGPAWACRECNAGGEGELDTQVARSQAREHWRHELVIATDLRAGQGVESSTSLS
jgi:hypothetical protein